MILIREGGGNAILEGWGGGWGGNTPTGLSGKNSLGENRMYTPTNTPTKYCINVLIHEMV